MLSVFQNKSIFLTGGTGSIGQALLQFLLAETGVKKVTVFSRDELKQWELEEELKFSRIDFRIGDVRDSERINQLIHGHEIVIHTAALKQLPKGEANPSEFHKTNVLGTENIVRAAGKVGVECVVFLSTDKAVDPSSTYGRGKLKAENLVIGASEMDGPRYIVLRMGNVMNTRGTVVPRFLRDRIKGKLKVTNPDNTRFHLTVQEAVQHICYAVHKGLGGEVVIPKLPAFSLQDLVSAVGNGSEMEVIGLCPGEKQHETLLTQEEVGRTIENEAYYIVLPPGQEVQQDKYIRTYGASSVSTDLSYSSNEVRQLTVNELQQLIEPMLSEKE